MSAALRVERIRSLEELHALGPEWRALETNSANTLPFLTWEWAVSWWAHLPHASPTLRDSLFGRALRSRAGELVGVAPLMITERPAVGPLRLRKLQFFGADPNITEIRGLLCLPGSEAGVYAALADDLRAEHRSWDWMLWSGLRAGEAGWEAITQRGEILPERDIPVYLLRLAPTWEEFRQGLKRNIRESLRKCYNSLERDGHRFTLEVVREREQISRAVREFLRLHAARAGMDGAVRHRDVFESAEAQRFLVDVCERLADRDAVRIFLLHVGGTVVAARIGFALHDTLYLYYSGYDSAWSRYSVMTTTVAEAIRYAIQEGFRVVNLSTGKDVSKTRWGASEVVYREVVQLSPSPRARLAYRAYGYTQAASLHPTLRRVLRTTLGRFHILVLLAGGCGLPTAAFAV